MHRPINWLLSAGRPPMLAGCGGGQVAKMTAASTTRHRPRECFARSRSADGARTFAQVVAAGDSRERLPSVAAVKVRNHRGADIGGDGESRTPTPAKPESMNSTTCVMTARICTSRPTPFSDAQVPRAIRILRTDPATGGATQVSSIPIDDDLPVQGLYVANGRLVMVTSGANFNHFGGVWIMLFIWAPTGHAIYVYDVSDPAHPVRILHAEVDGVFVASRRVGDRVYLVSRHTPVVVLDPLAARALRTCRSPNCCRGSRSAGRSRSLVSASDCYITNESGSQGLRDPDHDRVLLAAEPGRFREHLLQRGSQWRLCVELGALRVAAAVRHDSTAPPRVSTSSHSPTRLRPTRVRWRSRGRCGWAASATSA